MTAMLMTTTTMYAPSSIACTLALSINAHWTSTTPPVRPSPTKRRGAPDDRRRNGRLLVVNVHDGGTRHR
jgi:hypothetical protein